jgi:hypothetical protein
MRRDAVLKLARLLLLFLFLGSARAFGAFYFWNEVTGESTWKDPDHVPFVVEETGARYYVDANGVSTWTRPPDPSGWREFTDDNLGLPYFHNDVTGETTWERPAALGWTRVRADDPKRA